MGEEMRPAGQTAGVDQASLSFVKQVSGIQSDDTLTTSQATQATVLAGGLVFVESLVSGAFWGAVIAVGVNLFKGSKKPRRSSRRSR